MRDADTAEINIVDVVLKGVGGRDRGGRKRGERGRGGRKREPAELKAYVTVAFSQDGNRLSFVMPGYTRQDAADRTLQYGERPGVEWADVPIVAIMESIERAKLRGAHWDLFFNGELGEIPP